MWTSALKIFYHHTTAGRLHSNVREDAMRAADVMTPDPVCIPGRFDHRRHPADALTQIQRLACRGCTRRSGRDRNRGDLVRRTETGTQRKRRGWIEFLMGPGRLAAEYLQTAGRKVSE
jgi:hypothetical protein